LKAQQTLCVDNRLARLSTLIEQELAERGHLNLFLDGLTVEVPPSKAVLPAAVTEDKAAHAALASPETAQTADLLSCFSSSYLRPSHGLLNDSFQHLSKCTDLAVSLSVSTDTAYKAPSASTTAPATAPCLSNHEQADISSFADHSSQAAGPSVLEAAIAAYKQEKRKLWKVCMAQTGQWCSCCQSCMPMAEVVYWNGETNAHNLAATSFSSTWALCSIYTSNMSVSKHVLCCRPGKLEHKQAGALQRHTHHGQSQT